MIRFLPSYLWFDSCQSSLSFALLHWSYTHQAKIADFGVARMPVPVSPSALPQASECLTSGNLASLKDATMDAPDDAVLRVAELAVSCTVERTASRPSMALIATQLQAVREEVAGKEELREAVKVDTEVQEMREDPPGDLDEELREIGVILSGRLPGQDRAECSAREPLMDSSAAARSPDLQNSSSLALQRSSSDVACEISCFSG
ncbi:unnamed protein product [Closterium sp. NIES-54]